MYVDEFQKVLDIITAYIRFLAFYSGDPSGLCDGETLAKWPSKATFPTHTSTETEWPPKLLTRFSS